MEKSKRSKRSVEDTGNLKTLDPPSSSSAEVWRFIHNNRSSTTKKNSKNRQYHLLLSLNFSSPEVLQEARSKCITLGPVDR